MNRLFNSKLVLTDSCGFICIDCVNQVLQRVTIKELAAFSIAGAVAEEVLSAVRIVAAYSGEDKECDR